MIFIIDLRKWFISMIEWIMDCWCVICVGNCMIDMHLWEMWWAWIDMPCDWSVSCWVLCVALSGGIVFVWREQLCMLIVMLLYNYTQWYYNPVSHPSAGFECSMRHCRLDAGGLLRRLALRPFVGLSALICSTGSREIVV